MMILDTGSLVDIPNKIYQCLLIGAVNICICWSQMTPICVANGNWFLVTRRYRPEHTRLAQCGLGTSHVVLFYYTVSVREQSVKLITVDITLTYKCIVKTVSIQIFNWKTFELTNRLPIHKNISNNTTISKKNLLTFNKIMT